MKRKKLSENATLMTKWQKMQLYDEDKKKCIRDKMTKYSKFKDFFVSSANEARPTPI